MTAAQIKAAIRTVFVVLALSFHSTIEGLALALEDEGEGVWINTGATALHKFVISFSVGIELVSNKVTSTRSLLLWSSPGHPCHVLHLNNCLQSGPCSWLSYW